MKKVSIEELRLQFHAETDLEIKNKTNLKTWQTYALWLEIFQAEKLNQPALKEVKFLRKQIHHVLAALEAAISRRI